MIHFGNKSVEMVLTMMIGIRNSVTSLGENEKLYNFDEDDDAFKDVNLFEYTQKSYEKDVVRQSFKTSLSTASFMIMLLKCFIT